MSGSWRDISRILGVLIALSLIAYNLYDGTDILKSLFRGAAAYLIFTIANTVFTAVIYRIVNEYELKRLEQLNSLEDELSLDDDEEEDTLASFAERPTE